jgi:4-alpha-glucanotransferase
LRRAFAHAACLRVDHVMGLHRLYWVPSGFDARHGTYVNYRSDELRALVALEAHRAGAVVVGEDLGTVPAKARRAMTADSMLRSWVLQFETSAERPLPSPPSRVLASWGTHDLPRFAAFFMGDDIAEAEQRGALSAARATLARQERLRWRRSLCAALGAPGDPSVPHTPTKDEIARAYAGCLAHLAAGDADLVLVDLEDTWGERAPQNRPGTGPEEPNWRRRSAYTLAELQRSDPIAALLAEVDRLRAGKPRPPPRSALDPAG